MKSITVAVAAAAALVLAGCATAIPTAEQHAAHHQRVQPSAPAADQQMKTMHEMHQKMMSAKTPQERQALMAEHMKAMQGGMAVMCEMGQMMGSQGQSGGMTMQKGAGHQEMMQRCMAMRDMTTRMMTERESVQK